MKMVKMPYIDTLIIKTKDGKEYSLFEREERFWRIGSEKKLMNVSLRIEKREYIPIPVIRIIKSEKIEAGFIIPFLKDESLTKRLKTNEIEFAEFPYALIRNEFISTEKLSIPENLKGLCRDIIEEFEKPFVEKFLSELEQFPFLYDDVMIEKIHSNNLRSFLLNDKILIALKDYILKKFKQCGCFL